jgi:hypothetical protein
MKAEEMYFHWYAKALKELATVLSHESNKPLSSDIVVRECRFFPSRLLKKHRKSYQQFNLNSYKSAFIN